MAGELAVAYVTVRPRVEGFRTSASSQIRRDLAGTAAATTNVGTAAKTSERDVGRFNRTVERSGHSALGMTNSIGHLQAAFLGAAGLLALVHVGAEEFEEMTRTSAVARQLIVTTGGAAHVTAEEIEKLAKEQELLTGVNDEVVKSAEGILLTFRHVRNELGDGNDIFTRAIELANDMSRIFKQDLSGASLQLGKALEDPVRGMTALRRSGITFTKEQQNFIKSLVASGRSLDAQRFLLNEVEHQVGGTAAAIGKTLPGQLDILRERAKDSLGEFIQKLSESDDAASLAAAGAETLSGVWAILTGTADALLPPVKAIAHAAGVTADALGGVQPILAAVVAYKAVGIAVRVGTGLQARYAAAAKIASGTAVEQATAEEAAAAAQEAHVVALGQAVEALTIASRAIIAYSGATAASTVTTGAATVATAEFAGAQRLVVAGGAELVPILSAEGGVLATVAVESNVAAAGLVRVAESEVAVGVAGRAMAASVGAGRLALAAVGGPLGAVAIGAAAAVFGLYKLNKWADSAPGTIGGATQALNDLDTALERGRKAREALAGLGETVSERRIDVEAARKELDLANKAATQSKAVPGSIERGAVDARAIAARVKLRDATRALTLAENQRQRGLDRIARQQRDRASVTGEVTKKLLEQVEAMKVEDRVEQRSFFGHKIPVGIRLIQDRLSDPAAFRKFQDNMRGVIATGERADRIVGTALLALGDSLGRLPTKKEIEIAVRLTGDGATVSTILSQIGGGIGLGRKQAAAQKSIEDARRAGIERTAEQENRALQEQADALGKLLKAERAKVVERKKALATAKQETAAVREQRKAAEEALAAARRAVLDARQSLIDTRRSAADAITASVNDAKQNLRSLADAVAEALGRIGKGTTALTAAQRSKLAELRRQALAGQGGPGTRIAAERIQETIAGASRGGADNADVARRKLADLSDQFDRGKITAREFNHRLDKLLKEFKFNSAAFSREFGTAARNDLLDQIVGLRRQAAAIAAGPDRRGGGGAANIVKPLEAVAEGNRQIKQAEHDVRDAVRDVGKAAHDLSKLQLEEQKAIKETAREQVRLTRATNRKLDVIADLQRAPDGKKPSHAATGMVVGGQGGTDTVPAMLTPGEVVINANQQSRLRGMLGVGSGSPEQLFSLLRGFATGGVARIPLGLHGVGRQIWHSGPRVYRLRHLADGTVPRIPLRRNIEDWIEPFVGQGVSRAQAVDTTGWWGDHWPSQARYAGGGAVQRFRAGGTARIPLGRYGVGRQVWHSGPNAYRLVVAGRRPLIPIRGDISGFLDGWRGRGLSTAQSVDTNQWWRGHWPSQARYSGGGVARLAGGGVVRSVGGRRAQPAMANALLELERAAYDEAREHTRIQRSIESLTRDNGRKLDVIAGRTRPSGNRPKPSGEAGRQSARVSLGEAA